MLFIALAVIRPETGAAGTEYVYDDLGRVVQAVNSDGSITQYRYDPNGNLIAIDRANGSTLSITSFTPLAAYVGQAVTISGTGFSAVPGENAVIVGGVAATVLSASPTTLVITVPAAAMTGPVSVTVAGVTVTSGDSLVVLRPTITSFSPRVVSPGGQVTLNGTNLNLAPGTTITVGGTPVTVTSLTNVKAVFTAPSATPSGIRSTSHGTARRTYDAQGNPLTRTDFNGNQTLFLYDPVRNLETWRTEAAGTPQERVITTQWHPTYRMPTQIDQPGQRTNSTYDSAGNLLTKTITDLATSTVRTWTYTYNAVGQVLTIDGPRPDVSDVTTFTYSSCTSGYGCGQLSSVTDAGGNVTQYLIYDAHGNPLTISDPNGLVTTLTYDARQRVTSRAVGSETTTYEYWPTGLLKKTTLPDGSFISYTYDTAHRLIGIADGEGNRIAYTLDAAGNRTKEEVFDPSNALARTRSFVFDNLGHLHQEIGAVNQTVTYEYDDAGNRQLMSDARDRLAFYEYDALNRQSAITDPTGHVTQFGYDARDNLVTVSDPRQLQTSYTYNGFNDLTALNSPDTGVSQYTPDSAGNLHQSTDARGRDAQYTYDTLGRVTAIDYPDQTIQFTYDTGANAKGHLSGVTDGSGSTQFTYDSHGRVTSKTQTVGSVARTVGYSYNAAGQLASTTTPSGQVIAYTYTNNRITGVTVNGTTLVRQILYSPFGPTRGWQWGNGSLTAREYDTDGQHLARAPLCR